VRHSLCHGWAGGPAALLMTALTGLRILEPGFRRIRLAPVLGGLRCFDCSIPTPHGMLKVHCDRNSRKPEIVLPDGVEMEMPQA